MNSKLMQYSHLWDGTEPGWVLVLHAAQDGISEDSMSIYNELTQMALIIEDDILAREVRSQMLAAGIRTIVNVSRVDFVP
jgi:hypothetical protein